MLSHPVPDSCFGFSGLAWPLQHKVMLRFSSLLHVQSHLPPFLTAFYSWDRKWECGLMDSFFQLNRLPKFAVGLLFCSFPFLVFVSLCDPETLCSHFPRSTFLTSAIKDGYGSSAVLAFPSHWLRLWGIFLSCPAQALSVTLVFELGRKHQGKPWSYGSCGWSVGRTRQAEEMRRGRSALCQWPGTPAGVPGALPVSGGGGNESLWARIKVRAGTGDRVGGLLQAAWPVRATGWDPL